MNSTQNCESKKHTIWSDFAVFSKNLSRFRKIRILKKKLFWKTVIFLDFFERNRPDKVVKWSKSWKWAIIFAWDASKEFKKTSFKFSTFRFFTFFRVPQKRAQLLIRRTWLSRKTKISREKKSKVRKFWKNRKFEKFSCVYLFY